MAMKDRYLVQLSCMFHQDWLPTSVTKGRKRMFSMSKKKFFFEHLLCPPVDLMLALIHLIDLVAMNVLLNRRDISLRVSMSDKK